MAQTSGVSLAWSDQNQDRVSPSGPFPNNIHDGHFILSLNVNSSVTIQTIELYSTDSAGNKSGQDWISTGSGGFFLGVYQGGVLVNNNAQNSANLNYTVSGQVTLDLFGDTPQLSQNVFSVGNSYGVTITFSNGTTLKALTVISNTASPTPPITTTPPATGTGPTISLMSVTVTPPSNPPTSTTGTPEDHVVTIQVSGINIVDKAGQAKATGEGHLIYYENIDPPTFANSSAVPSQGSYTVTTSIPYTFQNRNPGYYSYAVQLVNNDNTPLNPPVYAVVKGNLTYNNDGTALSILAISVGPSIPSPSSATPTPTPTSGRQNNVLLTRVTGFKLAAKIGQGAANIAGEGHLIYYENMNPPTTPGSSALTTVGGGVSSASNFIPFSWRNDTPAYYTEAVQLVNNDDTPLNPPVFIMIKTKLQPSQSVTTATSTTGTPTPTPAPIAQTPLPISPQGSIPDVLTLFAFNNTFSYFPVFAGNNISIVGTDYVFITLINLDNSSHNFSLYTDSSAKIAIFKGAVISGPDRGIVYAFPTPYEGTYYFQSDDSPGTMSGTIAILHAQG